MSDVTGEERLRRLIAVGRSLVSEFGLDTLLSQLLEVARELAGAHYATLGVLDEEQREIERFSRVGSTRQRIRAIGDPPRARRGA
ncbi:MAG: hypothetical protein WB998_04975 [Solirubrobacteraceae bacterium]